MTVAYFAVVFAVGLLIASVLLNWGAEVRRYRGATSARESRRVNDRIRDEDLFYRRQSRAREFRDRLHRERLRRESERPGRSPGAAPTGQPRSAEQPVVGPEARYRETLGLGPGPVTAESLRRQYRAQMTAYHPDRVAGLGIKLQHLAEEETKAINEAYAYFKAHLAVDVLRERT